MTEDTKKDNTKLFRKIVRDYNAKYGYNFKFDKDADLSGEYAHPTHKDKFVHISHSQISDNHDSVYAQRMKIGEFTIPVNSSESIPLEELHKLVKSDAFQEKLKWLKILEDTSNELGEKISTLRHHIFEDALSENEKEELYDLLITTAKQLYRNK